MGDTLRVYEAVLVTEETFRVDVLADSAKEAMEKARRGEYEQSYTVGDRRIKGIRSVRWVRAEEL